jgi:hypothetical protein
MHNRQILPLCLPACLALLLGLTSCSEDSGTGSEPQIDQVAPVVIDLDPDDATDVALDQPVVIRFSEAMDQESAAGNITLSVGTITGYTWQDGTTLTISHTEWPEATAVTVSIGSGLTDLAGNPLPRAWSGSFWTYSPSAIFLESDPPAGVDETLRSISPRLRFSRRMDLTSLAAATTISDVIGPDKVVPSWDIYDIGDNWYRIVFAEPLAALTSYMITVSTAARVEDSLEHLAQPVSIDFTTGTEIDNIAPRLTASYPSGESVDPNQTTITLTFSEPIADDDFGPSRMAGQMMVLMNGEPVWNPQHTELTLYVRSPLPAGVRLFAVFPPGSYRDLSGNHNTTTDSVSFTVAGTADCFPVHADWYYYYTASSTWWSEAKEEWTGQFRLNFTDIAGNDFTYLRSRWDEWEDKWVISDQQYMRKSTSGVYFTGFHDNDTDADIMFSPEVLYQKMPFQGGLTWNGTATAAWGQQSLSVTYNGNVLGQETLVTLLQDMGQMRLIWENCWKSVLYHELGNGEVVFETGADTLWYAPAIGVIQKYSGNVQSEGEVTEHSWHREFLTEVSIGE